MKLLSKKLLIFGAAVLLIISGLAMIAQAEEGQGDVYHHKIIVDENEVETWTYVLSEVTKNEVDIKDLSYSVDGTTLTVTMEVYDNVQTSSKHAYIVYFNTSDATYIFTSTTIGVAVGYSWEYFNNPDSINVADILEHMATGTFELEGRVLTGTIELLGSSDPTTFWGSAKEFLVDYDTVTETGEIEFWVDFSPDTYAPWYGADAGDGDGDGTVDGDGDGDTGDGEDTGETPKTPGFEIITLIAAIAVAVILLRKRK